MSFFKQKIGSISVLGLISFITNLHHLIASKIMKFLPLLVSPGIKCCLEISNGL
ncbi:hypothetical protein X975_11491, partial [Stegodyphus mimosarum]